MRGFSLSTLKPVVIIGILISVLSGLVFLVFQIWTQDKVCGWQGVGIKEWPCYCLGKKTSLKDEWSENRVVNKCTGLNLSCSEFMLRYFFGGGRERPASCEWVTKIYQ